MPARPPPSLRTLNRFSQGLLTHIRVGRLSSSSSNLQGPFILGTPYHRRYQLGHGLFSRTAGFSSHTLADGGGRRTVSLSYALAMATVLCSTTYLLGLFAPPSLFQLIYPRPAPGPLPANSEEGKRHTEKIERELLNLDLLKQCREREDADEWYETRPYAQLPPENAINNLTAGILRGPGKIAVPPLVRSRKDETEAWVFVHLGRSVCGHDGVVHGGLLATLLDEGCGRNAILAFPSRIGVTANLTLDYKAPTKADQFVVIKTKLIELKGRKATVHGQMEDLQGNVLVQVKAIFIEPKFASVLNAAGSNAIFPSAQERIARMTGGPTKVAAGGQPADEGAVEGKP